MLLVVLGLCGVAALSWAAPAPGEEKPQPPTGRPEGVIARVGRPPAAHQGPIQALAFSPDGATLVTVSRDAAVAWDAKTGRRQRRLFPRSDEDKGELGAQLAFAPDGRTIAVARAARGYLLLDAHGRRPPVPGPGQVPESAVDAMTFSPDGKLLALSGNGTLVVFRAGEDTPFWQFRAHGFNHRAIAFTPDGKVLAAVYHSGLPIMLAAGPDRRASLLRSGRDICYAVAVCFARDGRSLTAAYEDGPVLLWEVASGRLRHEFPRMDPALGHDSACPTVFSPDGRLLARGTPKQGGVSLFDVPTGKEVWRRTRHAGAVLCLAFSPDGKTLASGGEDGTAVLWDVSRVKPADLPHRQERLSAKQLEALWSDLAADDAAKAYRAVLALSADPDRGLPLLAQRTQLSAEQRKRLARALTDLDADDFHVRERASAELEKLADLAGDELRLTREVSPSAEVRRRVERLLEKLDRPVLTPERLRRERALEALERASAAAKRELLP
jgi:hypothetical protein